MIQTQGIRIQSLLLLLFSWIDSRPWPLIVWSSGCLMTSCACL